MTVTTHITTPRHVAIIMDGNGRWAKRQGKPRHAGHRAGVKSVRSSVEYSVKQGVEVLTLFAFSSENWQRPEKEVSMLMELFMTALKSEVKKLHKNNVRLKIIGDRTAFSDKLQKQIQQAEDKTAENTGLILQIAANYGGRWDITQSVRKLAEDVNKGQLDPGDINEETIRKSLSFADLPEVDLFIRTGGDLRISNFILWQAAYAELYFTPVLWPDFNEAAYQQALNDFAGRQRRFGKTGEQLAGED
ncbi:MAG: di-trans,poly-cis-decaprenylcistransferase [Gammaproteobacteria bacterium]|nr:di-trans,poly-cis-decaprenylcistransferase [Gammaproteobacteria bacterium]NNJ90293.1 di-trans,poly-cis-decaprenylcistransferase [Gammaproteobacteria bacterium]